MQPQAHDRPPKETPLERIFRRLVGRKMTEPERIAFHLKHPPTLVKRKRR
jgi:hypothetical protein